MYDLWVVSSEQHEVMGKVELRFISVDTGMPVRDSIVRENVRIAPNGTTNIVVGGVIDHVANPEPHVLAARLWIRDQIISRDTDWPQPLKYLDFSNRGLEVKMVDQHTLAVSVDRPLKCLVFEERDGVILDDNALDVVPADEQMVHVSELGSKPLSWKFLGQ